MKVAGLFAGIGGFELGFAAAGLETSLVCDVLPTSKAVLGARFPNVEFREDVRDLRSLSAIYSAFAKGNER